MQTTIRRDCGEESTAQDGILDQAPGAPQGDYNTAVIERCTEPPTHVGFGESEESAPQYQPMFQRPLENNAALAVTSNSNDDNNNNNSNSNIPDDIIGPDPSSEIQVKATGSEGSANEEALETASHPATGDEGATDLMASICRVLPELQNINGLRAIDSDMLVNEAVNQEMVFGDLRELSDSNNLPPKDALCCDAGNHDTDGQKVEELPSLESCPLVKGDQVSDEKSATQSPRHSWAEVHESPEMKKDTNPDPSPEEKDRSIHSDSTQQDEVDADNSLIVVPKIEGVEGGSVGDRAAAAAAEETAAVMSDGEYKAEATTQEAAADAECHQGGHETKSSTDMLMEGDKGREAHDGAGASCEVRSHDETQLDGQTKDGCGGGETVVGDAVCKESEESEEVKTVAAVERVDDEPHYATVKKPMPVLMPVPEACVEPDADVKCCSALGEAGGEGCGGAKEVVEAVDDRAYQRGAEETRSGEEIGKPPPSECLGGDGRETGGVLGTDRSPVPEPIYESIEDRNEKNGQDCGKNRKPRVQLRTRLLFLFLFCFVLSFTLSWLW